MYSTVKTLPLVEKCRLKYVHADELWNLRNV